MTKTTGSTTTSNTTWTSTQAYVLAIICLLVGVAVGYLVRGSAASEPAATSAGATQPTAMPTGMGQRPTPEQMKHMAEKQAEPLLAQLQSNSNDPALLAQIGNVYYDAQVFKDAADYYTRSLNIDPKNADVRTDMGTAYWYMGDADRAIAEFQTVLKAEPTKASTLMNLGVVQWQGKMDAKAATATWQKLLATNPNYENKDKVEQLLSQVRQHLNIKPGTKTDKPAL